jgi:hypothetical protein
MDVLLTQNQATSEENDVIDKNVNEDKLDAENEDKLDALEKADRHMNMPK